LENKMTQAAKSVFDAALSLPEAERAELVEKLLASLDEVASESPEEVESAWIEESERRVRAMDAGTSEELPGDEILDAMKKRENASPLKTRNPYDPRT
jgi:putative addiction module component (TIGR02574 family)